MFCKIIREQSIIIKEQKSEIKKYKNELLKLQKIIEKNKIYKINKYVR